MQRKLNASTIGFDFDQTLMDTSKGIVETVGSVLELFDISFREAQLFERLNLPLDQIFEPWAHLIDVEEAKRVFQKSYLKIAMSQSYVLPGVQEFLDELRNSNSHVIIVSAKRQNNLEALVARLRFDFKEVVGEAYQEKKTQALRDLGAIAYIGDHPHDISSAHHVPCHGFATLTGFSQSEDFKEVSPELIVKDLREYKKIIDYLESENT